MSQGIQPGLTLGGRYRVVRQLGHGGFGRAYVAQDLNRFNELCVLKEFAPQVQGTYALQKTEELFEREAGVLYQLQHPQIPRFREIFRVMRQEKGFLFLVQDFVEGQTYYAILEQRKRQGLGFSEAEVTQLMLHLLPVLQYIHSLGVIHRDIAPDNLMLRSTDGLPVLIDFGGVKQVAATVASQFLGAANSGGISSSATCLGKVGYAPQEQMLRGIVSPNSDLYALAVTALVLITGREPQQLMDPQTLRWNWRQQSNLSINLRSVLDKMLQPIPGERYQSASEVLQSLLGSPAPTAYQTTPQPLPEIEATLPIVPSPVNQPSPPTAEVPLSSSGGNRSPGLLGKLLLLVISIAAVGSLSFWVTSMWIHARMESGDKDKSLNVDNPLVPAPDEVETPPPPQFSPEEQQRKQTLRQQRTSLGVAYRFYVDLVDEEFWSKYPNQRGRPLSVEPGDAQLREEWDAIAAEQLEKLEESDLSSASRQLLGSYKSVDLNRWKNEANKLHVSSRALYDLADAKFLERFPEEQGKKFIDKPIGQVWQAFVADMLMALQSRETLEQIVFEQGAVSQEVSGTLQPGEGKVFIAQLSAGQLMNVKLQTARRALFSIYGPTRGTTLLEDSRDRTWSGELPESGFYELVLVSKVSEPINYQLDLTVENQESSESPADESTEPGDLQ
ncbi:protein kinase domain-containing protein [Lyngbya aestuarii]|uniref:protein kinase domain-containing protein n=1 Tax=Lyngbya aestuarii TaxID=118322 RepID=UPI00403D6659